MASDAQHKDSQDQYSAHITYISDSILANDDSERRALQDVSPAGFYLRPPPEPHDFVSMVTPESELFQTIHMGAAMVDEESWKLVITGMVERSFSISLPQLKAMPRSSVMAFHECYGSPIKPPTTALWRIGNVRWAGVPLCELLKLARPKHEAAFLWSQGLEHGSFAGVSADRYEKDLPLEKALSPEVLVAYEMNDQPLTKNRGGPVRLVVPGYFGTNSTKWLCKLSLQDRRASGPFTTTFYNEKDPTDPAGERMRPVWQVEPNSMIVRPIARAVLPHNQIEVFGKAWGCAEIVQVEISIDGGQSWLDPSIVNLQARRAFEWQEFRATVKLRPAGKYTLAARATDKLGTTQPLSDRRNHIHKVEVDVT